MANKYYQKNKEKLRKESRVRYQKRKERIRKKAREKYQNLYEGKGDKRQKKT